MVVSEHTYTIIAHIPTHALFLGDYDGDKVEVFWNEDIVKSFIPPDQSSALDPPDLSDSFTQSTVTVSEFLSQTAGMPEIEQIHAIQKHLLSSLDSDGHLLGLYNELWLMSMYHNGYGHKETQELAYKSANPIFSIPVSAEKLVKQVHHDPRWSQDRVEDCGHRVEK